MGKKKNKNKPSGAEKTAAKTEKKLAKKFKKDLAGLGGDDIEAVVAALEQERSRRVKAVSVRLLQGGPEPPRAYATLTKHPHKDQLLLFGGEYHDADKTVMFDELLVWSPGKGGTGEWRRVEGGEAWPAPRSAHQAIALPKNKGELWVFGGEMSSADETHFHHYRDLWLLRLGGAAAAAAADGPAAEAQWAWERVWAGGAGGPSARSGHRMVALDAARLALYGGYQDSGRGPHARYLDDLYLFDTAARLWTRVQPAGAAPSGRSGALLAACADHSLLVYGGFSADAAGCTTHRDGARLVWGGAGGAGGAVAGRWVPAAPLGAAPARASLAYAKHPSKDIVYVFGGVTDKEESEESLEGEASDQLLMLDLACFRFREVRPAPAPAAPASADPAPDPAPAALDPQPVTETLTIQTDDVFTMRLGAPAGAAGGGAAPAGAGVAAGSEGGAPVPGGPSPRLSAMAAMLGDTLVLYGGVEERGGSQRYLADMYSVRLRRDTTRAPHRYATLLQPRRAPTPPASDTDGSSDADADSDSDTDGSSDTDTDAEGGSLAGPR